MAIIIGLKNWRAGFVCDVCKQPIIVAGTGTDGAGIVIYKSENRSPSEFQIVHKLRCDFRNGGNPFTCWMSLEDLLDELKQSLSGLHDADDREVVVEAYELQNG